MSEERAHSRWTASTATLIVAQAPSGLILFCNGEASVVGRHLLDAAGDLELARADGTPCTPSEWPPARSLASGEVIAAEDVHAVAAGSRRRSLRWSSTPVYDDRGRMVAAAAVLCDITPPGQRDQELAYLDSLLANIDDAVVGTDADFRVTVWNRGAERLYGYRAAEALGRPAREVTGHAGGRSRPHRDLISVAVRDEREAITGYLGIHREPRTAATDRDQRVAQQALVAQLGRRALTTDDIQTVMDEAVRAVEQAFVQSRVAIMELMPCGDQLRMRAGTGWSAGVVGTATSPVVPTSLMGHALMEDQPVVSDDVAGDPRFELPPFLRDHGAVSAGTVVIAGREQPFGVLGAFTTGPQRVSVDDVDFLRAVANVVSAAVDRAASRRASRQLRGAIDDLGVGVDVDQPFARLLRQLVAVQQAAARDGTIVLDVRPGVPQRPLGPAAVEILRIAREALINARRHAHARSIRVSAWGSDHLLHLEVADDGHGFDPTSCPATGTGIRGMRARAALAHGGLEIRSVPGAGTVVRFTVALVDGRIAAERPTRILLVDDHVAVRQAIAAVFEREAGFVVVGQASTLADARDMLVDVDLVVVDLDLPDGSRGNVIRELRDVNPRAQALVLTASLDRRQIAEAIESGAAGTLSTSVSLDDVVAAVRRLRAGEALLPLDEVVELMRFAVRQRELEQEDRMAIERLTPREHEVLQALADGFDAQGVADRLHITVRTERNHVANILMKLGVHSQLQAVLLAARYGVVSVG